MASAAIKVANILPEFDRRSLPAYSLLAVIGSTTVATFVFCGVDLSAVSQFWALEIALLLIFVAVMLRRAGHIKIATALETNAVVVVMAVLLLPVQFPLGMFRLPMVDRLLFDADQALGFDWLTFAHFFYSMGSLPLLSKAYFSMDWQGPSILIVLAAFGQTDRAWRFVIAVILAFLIPVALLPIFSADGRYVLCGLRPSDVQIIGRLCEYPRVLHGLRDGSLTTVTPEMAVGMVTFPSAHAAVALLFVWAIWPIWYLRVPSVLLNIALCAGAIVIGSHYFVDIIGGLALGLGCVKLAATIETRNARKVEWALLWAAIFALLATATAIALWRGFHRSWE